MRVNAPLGDRWNRRWLLVAVAALGVLRGDRSENALDAPAEDLDRQRPDGAGVPAGSINVLDHGVVGDGRADDTRALQAVVNAHPGRVISFPYGIYRVSQLLLADHTYLHLGTAVIRRQGNVTGGSAGATLRNVDLVRGNTDITVLGGTVEGGARSTGRLVSLVNCSDVRVDGLTLSKGASSFVDWMFLLEGCDVVRVSNVHIAGGVELGEDGLHIKGSSRVVVDNCVIESGDDAIAIVQQYHQAKPIRDVSITNCTLSSRVAHMIRISVYPQELHGISGVVLSNIVGRGSPSRSAGTPVLINDDTASGLVHDVNIDNVVIDATLTSGDVWHLVGLRDSSIRGARVLGAGTHAFLVVGCDAVAFTDCHATAPQPSNGNPGWTVDGSTNISLAQCSVRDAAVHSFEVTGGSSNVQLNGCRSLDPAADSFHLARADRVAIVGCLGSGGIQGVGCESSTTRVTVTGCVLVGNVDEPFKNPPVISSYLGNIDR